MVVIGLTQQVSTDAELKALTGMVNNHIVFHNGQNSAFMFYANHDEGMLVPDVGSGVWKKEDLKCLSLNEYKECRHKEIDERTAELIDAGFVFDGHNFSLSINARDNWNVIHDNKALFTFPLDISTSDSDTYSLAEIDIDSFWLTGLGTIKTHYDSGRALKKLVFDAITEQDVQNIIDLR